MLHHIETSQLSSLQLDCLVLYGGNNDGEGVNCYIINKNNLLKRQKNNLLAVSFMKGRTGRLEIFRYQSSSSLFLFAFINISHPAFFHLFLL